LFGWDSVNGWQFSWLGVALAAVVIGFGIRRSHLKTRRRRSLRRDDDGLYFWIELDGSPTRSSADPRDKWDKDDADDSDGDGGD
jgi:hypothetical protein